MRNVGVDDEEVKDFIRARLSREPFGALVAVSFSHYPDELFTTVWLGGEPDREMRVRASEIEAELRLLGIRCSILLKSDRDLPLGCDSGLSTTKGRFECRYYEVEPVGNEDCVYAFSVFRDGETYRFRIALSGALASLLRRRNMIQEERLLAIYLDTIRRFIETRTAIPADVQDVTFTPADLQRFLDVEPGQRTIAG